ncbi:hypothetical protein LCGC14_2868230, partial [marine sediment metagenome]
MTSDARDWAYLAAGDAGLAITEITGGLRGESDFVLHEYLKQAL